MTQDDKELIADKIHFAVIAIEAAARKMGTTPADVRRRLEKTNLMKRQSIHGKEN